MDIVFKALNFAAKSHDGQKLGKDVDPQIPYITHPVAVALIVSKIGVAEETIAAGLLHDVIEDCDITKEELEREFGPRVAEMVDDLSEQNRSASWSERKEKAISRIKTMSNETLLIKTADIIHNLTMLLETHEKIGMSVFNLYKAPYKDQVEMNKKRYQALAEKWSENPLLPWLKDLVDKLADLQS